MSCSQILPPHNVGAQEIIAWLRSPWASAAAYMWPKRDEGPGVIRMDALRAGSSWRWGSERQAKKPMRFMSIYTGCYSYSERRNIPVSAP